MVTIKNILVPTDFSESATAAYAYAREMAAIFKSKIILIHVYEPIVFYSEAPIGMPDLVDIEKNIYASSEQSLDRIIQEHFKSDSGSLPGVEKMLVQGKPFIEIIRVAKDQGIDMIIMSTHGRSALEHILLGSVTEKVVRKAPCPVLTIRSKSDFVMP
jgi:nucleotide-binding universal stress UspA family protein